MLRFSLARHRPPSSLRRFLSLDVSALISERAGVTTSRADAFLSRNKEVFESVTEWNSYFDQLENLGFSKKNLSTLLASKDAGVALLPFNNIARTLDFLSALRLPDTTSMVAKCPWIVMHSEKQFEGVVHTLCQVFSKRQMDEILVSNLAVLTESPEDIAERFTYITLSMGVSEQVASYSLLWRHRLPLFKARHELFKRMGMYNSKSVSRMPVNQQRHFLRKIYGPLTAFLTEANISKQEWIVFLKTLSHNFEGLEDDEEEIF